MALIIDLKPTERIVIGDAIITNDSARTRLHIEGTAPILREKDIMREEDATSPSKKIYFIVQLMYLSHTPEELFEDYFGMISDIQSAAPSTSTFFMKINDHITEKKYYKALKEAKALMKHEEELISNVLHQ